MINLFETANGNNDGRYSSKELDHKFEIEEGKLNLFVKNSFNFGFLSKSPKLVVKVPKGYSNIFANATAGTSASHANAYA